MQGSGAHMRAHAKKKHIFYFPITVSNFIILYNFQFSFIYRLRKEMGYNGKETRKV